MNSFRLTSVCFVFICFVTLPVAVFAKSGGITGSSGQDGVHTCAYTGSCHSDTNAFSASATIVKSGTTTTPISAFTSHSYSYTVLVTGTGAAAGFDLSVSGGTLSSSQSDVTSSNGELTHSTPKAMSGNQAAWNFTWSTPSSVGTVNFYLCGNVVNMNNNFTGDDPACAVIPVSVTTQVVVDTTPPVIGTLSDITIDSFSHLTPYTLPQVTAVDNVDGTIGAVADNTGPYHTGATVITWTATDSSGNSSTATQNLFVTPQLNTLNQRNVSSGSSFSFDVYLNGDAVTYPVTVPISSTGSAILNTDFTLSSSSISVASGRKGSITVNVAPGASNKTITLDLGASGSGQYILNNQFSQSFPVSNFDMAPEVSLGVSQGTASGDVVVSSGVVTVTANVNDPDNSASLSYDWTNSDATLLGASTVSTNTLSFDPAGLPVGVYETAVNVADSGGASTKRTLYLHVVSALPTFSAIDTDKDGVTDDVENILDTDYDGVADYLDFSTAEFILNTDAQNNIFQYIESLPGIQLRTGSLAQLISTPGALVRTTSLSGQSLPTGTLPNNTHAFYDLEAVLTPDQSGPVKLALPVSTVLFNVDQLNVYSANNGWHLFVTDANNYMQYANASSGICPPPLSTLYATTGKNVKSCIELTITDGGPNDADDTVNGIVRLRAGSMGSMTSSVVVTPDSGGGSLGVAFISLCLLCLGFRQRCFPETTSSTK